MINMTGNAACVIAERNAILNGIPKSLWSGAYEQAFALVAGTTKTLGEKLERATKAFALQGITMEQVLEKLGHQDLTKIIPDDIVTMRGMLTALKTGEETVETIFGRGAGSNHEKVQNPLKDDPEQMRGASTAAATADKAVDAGGKVTKDRDPITSGPQRTETDSNEAAKMNTAAPAAGEAEEKGPGKPAPDVQPTEKTAQTAAAGAPVGDLLGAKPYTDADGYMGFMRDNFDSAKARASKSAVTEIWGSTRADRNELLSADQIEELTKDKAATLAAIKLKEPK